MKIFSLLLILLQVPVYLMEFGIEMDIALIITAIIAFFIKVVQNEVFNFIIIAAAIIISYFTINHITVAYFVKVILFTIMIIIAMYVIFIDYLGA